MASAPIPDNVVLQVARMLDEVHAPYAFMGGLAVNAWGVPRGTFDIDFVVAVDAAAFGNVLQGLMARGIEIDEPFLRGYRDSLHGMEKVNASLLTDGQWVRLDAFRTNTPLLESAMHRRVAISRMSCPSRASQSAITWNDGRSSWGSKPDCARSSIPAEPQHRGGREVPA